MQVRAAGALALIAAVSIGAVPAHAAVKKPKPITGSYNLTLYPDPTPEVTNEVPGHEGCGVLPTGQDKHPFTVPAAGVLQVSLTSPDPTGGKQLAGLDWDLYILDSTGAIINSSHGATANEATVTKMSRKQGVSFWVCNLVGEPNGKVSYTFTYK